MQKRDAERLHVFFKKCEKKDMPFSEKWILEGEYLRKQGDGAIRIRYKSKDGRRTVTHMPIFGEVVDGLVYKGVPCFAYEWITRLRRNTLHAMFHPESTMFDLPKDIKKFIVAFVRSGALREDEPEAVKCQPREGGQRRLAGTQRHA